MMIDPQAGSISFSGLGRWMDGKRGLQDKSIWIGFTTHDILYITIHSIINKIKKVEISKIPLHYALQHTV